jgi:hypothetical protein
MNYTMGMLKSPPLDNWFYNDLPYGWAGEVAFPNKTDFDDHFQLYCDMVEWVEQNVNNHRSNVLWSKIGDCIYFQFRKKKDLMWFKLRWGA